MIEEDEFEFAFSDADSDETKSGPELFWHILVVDDDPAVASVTSLALKTFTFANRRIAVTVAESAHAALQLLSKPNEFALALVDVVMESNTAGLDLVHTIRGTLNNHTIRLLLRTGQPGTEPEQAIISGYEIDGYLDKSSLTSNRLRMALTTALRSYSLIDQLNKEREELARLNQELTQFTKLASHNLQTPLRAIVSFSERLKAVSEQLAGNSKTHLAHIIDNGVVLQKMLEALRQYTELESERFDSQEESARRLRALNVADLLNALALTDSIQMTVEQNLPPVNLSLPHFESLFYELIGNAIKFGANKIHVSGYKKDEHTAEFRVLDNATSIPADGYSDIFQPYYKMPAHIGTEGVGIGLSLAQKIARLHGGNLLAVNPENSEDKFNNEFVLTLKSSL